MPDLVTLVTNDKGRPFSVRLIRQGDKYGLGDCVTHDRDEPLVEFYDAEYANDDRFAPFGQFVARYYVTSLLTHTNAGLLLHGAHPDVWSIDQDTMSQVVSWLIANLYPHE